MALRIANNIAAMNTQRWLAVADTGMKKSLERLSSGYRINKAADDAAGLAISQSFRANIASFKVASRNTSEAAALLQVAEGGMDQIGNMLTRLKELATQSASANVGSSERAKIDSESTALLNEIDRIANSSKYGSTSLLDGTFGAAKAGEFGAGTSADGMIGSTYNTYDFALTGGSHKQGTVTVLGSGVAEGDWSLAILTSGKLAIGNADGSVLEATTGAWSADTTITFGNLGITMTFTAALTAGSVHTLSAAGSITDSGSVLTFKRTGLTSLNVESANTGTFTFDANTTALKITLGNGTITQTIDYSAGGTHNFDKLGISFVLAADSTTGGYDDDDLENMTIEVSSTGSAGNTFQIGAENNSYNQIQISVAGTRKADLGLTDLSLDTAANAQAALDLVDTAIGSLAGSRGDIGASMNRLAYASANLATTIENQQAAESVIRDVDMASEMTDFTKNQILLQAGTAMLAQANMAPQQVLALFG